MNRNNASNSHRNQPAKTRHCAAYTRAFQRLDEALAQNSSHNTIRKINMARLRLFGRLPE
jgi:hypothetical protein